MIRVEVKPELLRWGRERAGVTVNELLPKFPKYREWEEGNAKPTLRQLERFAKTTRTAVGYFFLSEPPEDLLPIPDFRTMGSVSLQRPSPDLLDTIYLCQQRQDWYREFLNMEGGDPVSFVGTKKLTDNTEEVAKEIRLAFGLDDRHSSQTWSESLSYFIDKVRRCRVLVMASGIVGSNTRRVLDPSEFRGFALVDELAPLIFINGADSKSAQTFTLAHELAHLWLGESALSDAGPDLLPGKEQEIETWCNRVAAELLVPLSTLREKYQSMSEDYQKRENLTDALNYLGRHFKVSTLVILRRILDIGRLTRREFREAYTVELNRLKDIPREKGGGGDFYQTLNRRVGEQFIRAVVRNTLEGKTSFTESFRLLGFRKLHTFDKVAQKFKVV